MKQIISCSIVIQAQKQTIWALITDIENAQRNISGIKKIVILNPASDGSIIGLKWQETREFMGKDAIEEMWITDAVENSFYETRAESHGCIYKSRLELNDTDKGTNLSMTFFCEPQTLGAKLMWNLTGWMAKKSLKKVIEQDLLDIKHAINNK